MNRSALVLLAACSVAAIAALVTIVSGESAGARRALGFGFRGVDRSISEASAIAIHNARLAGAALLCGMLAPRLPVRARVPIDGLLGLILVVNSGALGVAFGAYGWRAIAATAPHLPVEFAGLSVAGGAYLQARRQALSVRAIAAVGACTALLLLLAAALETYVSPGGTR